MDFEERLLRLKEYSERKKRILELSSLQLDEIDSDEEYRLSLHEAFLEIKELRMLNNEALKTVFFPLMDESVSLSDEDVELLLYFSSMMIDTTSMENLDQPLLFMQAERLLKEAEKKGDMRSLVLAHDQMVIASYMMFNVTARLYPERDYCFRYRDMGIRSALWLIQQLQHDRFQKLPDDTCRELVLINSRYIRCLFEWDDKPDRNPYNEKDIRLMEQALSLAEDPFYREQMPGYQWDAHIFRTLQYLADFTEDNNKHQFSHEQLLLLDKYTTELLEFIANHPEFEDRCPKKEQECYAARNAYLAGRISMMEYRKTLERLMERSDEDDFGARGMFVIFTAALEYIMTFDDDALTPEQEGVLRNAYDRMILYAFRMPKTGVLSFMLTYIAMIFRKYIRVPQGLEFTEMCQRIMAAMHPPTYVHSLSVANIARYLAEQLLKREPERFKKAFEGSEPEEILDHVYKSTMMHDIGKMLITETIITYGRDLIDEEIDLIRSHVEVGAELLKRYPETAAYADVALGHHKWFDNSHGYPESFNPRESIYETVIAIVSVADCMDAATDSIGRSYKKGESLEKFVNEVMEGSGTRYAPYVAELFKDEEILKELEKLLAEGRDENYRRTFRLLKTIIEEYR